MPADARRVFLLGPQRLAPTLREAVDAAGIAPGAPIAAVTAGWEEREHEDQELSEHLGGRVRNLRVYERCEDIYRRDPELHRAMRARHDRLRALQDLYRLRLRHALAAASELLAHVDAPDLVPLEVDDAIDVVRRLDARHLAYIAATHADFEAQWRIGEREAVARHRVELARILGASAALCIAGGHVAVLRNRMRLLDLVGQCPAALPVFAWSAGAMVACERVVLFHDSPPQGAGDAEVFVPGLGLAPGVVALPHARRRLKLDDAVRVALFARRFAPALCAALDERTGLQWDGGRWTALAGTRRFTAEGTLAEIAA